MSEASFCFLDNFSTEKVYFFLFFTQILLQL